MKSPFLRRVALVVAATASFAPLAHAQCGADVLFGTSCYRPTSASSSWSAAQSESRTFGGYLVSIGSAAENAFLVTQFVTPFQAPFDTFWIGLTDILTEGVYRWDSGEAVSFTDWSPGEPNDTNGNEDATQMYRNGRWNDVNRNASLRGIIEYDAVVTTPEPATALLTASGLLGIGGIAFLRRRIPRLR